MFKRNKKDTCLQLALRENAQCHKRWAVEVLVEYLSNPSMPSDRFPLEKGSSLTRGLQTRHKFLQVALLQKRAMPREGRLNSDQGHPEHMSVDPGT